MKLMDEVERRKIAVEVEAGGPGSGRHPGIHQELTNNGFQHTGDKQGYYGSFLPRKGLTSRYKHPDGRSASAHKSGSWAIHSPGAAMMHTGHGVELLREHFATNK